MSAKENRLQEALDLAIKEFNGQIQDEYGPECKLSPKAEERVRGIAAADIRTWLFQNED